MEAKQQQQKTKGKGKVVGDYIVQDEIDISEEEDVQPQKNAGKKGGKGGKKSGKKGGNSKKNK